MRSLLVLALGAALGVAATVTLSMLSTLSSHSIRMANADPAAATIAGPQDFSALVDRCQDSIVHIQTALTTARVVPEPDDRSAPDEYVGSGFVYASDGWIVTNRHVAEGASSILVEIRGRGWFVAKSVGFDTVVDVAVLKIDATGLSPLPIGDPRALRLGQWVIAAGSPYRLPRSFTLGIVSGLERSDVGTPNPYEDYIQSDAALNVGSSGGPLLDAAGRVVGINTAVLSRTGGNQGISFSVPIDVVVPVVEALRAGRPITRPSIGAVVRDATPREAVQLPGGAGQVITRFVGESPAKRAGLQVGDVILKVDGVPTPGRGRLLRTVWSKRPGTAVTVDIWRHGQVMSVGVTLGA